MEQPDQDIFNAQMRVTINRKMERMTTEELVHLLGHVMIQERQRKADEGKSPGMRDW